MDFNNAIDTVSEMLLSKSIENIATMLNNKKPVADTTNPFDNNLKYGFVIMGCRYTDPDGRTCYLLRYTAGENCHIRNMTRDCLNDGWHAWIHIFEIHYATSPIDLCDNIQTALRAFIKERIEQANKVKSRPITIRCNESHFIKNDHILIEEYLNVIKQVSIDAKDKYL